MPNARNLIGGGALVLALVQPVGAQLDVGNWVRQPIPSMPSITLTVEACCGSGRRLIYHIITDTLQMELAVESKLDGTDAPVTIAGKPSGETMAIKRIDDHHATAVLKSNGTLFGTAQSTLSPDGKTLTIVNDYSSPIGGGPVGKFTEVWVKK